MIKHVFIFIFYLGTSATVFGQSDSINLISKIVDRIDNDTTLMVKEFDATKIYNIAFDGGGQIKLYFNKNGLQKIDQQIGVSFGRLITIVYFNNGKPIKITDREENFKWNEVQSGWDYTELNQIFQADIFIFDWEMDKNKTLMQGQRKLSEGTCSIFEYEPLINIGYELIKNGQQ